VDDPVEEPTPEEAAAALHTVRESRVRVFESAVGARWMWIAGGVVVFGYTVATDLIPATQPWLTWVLLALVFGLIAVMRSRIGGSLLGRPVAVSRRTLPAAFRGRLLLLAPILGISIVVAVVVPLFHVPHGAIYYGALAGLFLAFLGPRLRLWVLRRQDRG
jgi:hypothetical protein